MQSFSPEIFATDVVNILVQKGVPFRDAYQHVGKELGETRNYSEEIAHKIDQEVERFIKDAYKTAKQVLTQKKNKLRQIADYLIKKEVIERKEFDKLMLTPA